MAAFVIRMSMRLALCVLLAACKSSQGPNPDFKNDVAVFCGAIDEGAMTNGIADLGPRILSRIRTDEFKKLFNMRQEDPPGALLDRLDAAAKRTGQARCPTLDWMRNGMR
jgi:hypothetical protein